MSTFVLNVMLAHLIDVTVSFQIYSHMMKIKFEKSQRNPYPLPLFVWVVSRAIFLRYFFSQFFFDKLESIFVHPNRLDFRCPIDGACAWIHHLLLFLFAFFSRAASKKFFHDINCNSFLVFWLDALEFTYSLCMWVKSIRDLKHYRFTIICETRNTAHVLSILNDFYALFIVQ